MIETKGKLKIMSKVQRKVKSESGDSAFGVAGLVGRSDVSQRD